MKSRRFAYHAPTSLPDALALLAEHSFDAKVLAGGQSLMPLLNFRMASPEHIVDINRLPDLDTPRRLDGRWHIPALVRQRTVERSPKITAAFPVLGSALTQVAHPQIRNRGTVCGSLAHGDPAAELPTVMSALQATMHLTSLRGERAVKADDFFVFHLTTALADDELLIGVSIDDFPPGTVTGFEEFATRHGDFALAAVAGVATRDVVGTVTACRLFAAGVAATPYRLAGAESIVLGHHMEPDVITAAGAAARREVDPTGDIHASADYRRHLLGVLVSRVLTSMSEKESDSHVR